MGIYFTQRLDWTGLSVLPYHAEVALSLALALFLPVFFPRGNFYSPLDRHGRGDKPSGLWVSGWADRERKNQNLLVLFPTLAHPPSTQPCSRPEPADLPMVL